MAVLRCKVAIIGDVQTGKSCLVQAFHKTKQFAKNYVMTVGCEYAVKSVKIPDTENSVELHMFDVAGSHIYQSIRQHYLQDSNYVLVIYDVTNRQSFTNAAKWVEEAKKNMLTTQKFFGILVGMKCDLNESSVVSQDEAAELAHEHGLGFFECSALSGKDVDTPFNFIANAFHLLYEEKRKQFATNLD